VIVISEDVWSADFEALADSFPIVREPDLWSKKDELKAKLADATALVVRNRTQVTREIIEAAPQLKIIARAGVGLDNIDIKAADENGVIVAAALGINATAVGEETLAMALALSRKLIELDSSTRIPALGLVSGIARQVARSPAKRGDFLVLAPPPARLPNYSKVSKLKSWLTIRLQSPRANTSHPSTLKWRNLTMLSPNQISSQFIFHLLQKLKKSSTLNCSLR